MAIARYTNRNPWRELDLFSNRLNRLFDGNGWPAPSSGGDWNPAVDVDETPDELTLTAELPGLTEDDIDIELENDVLTLRGDRAEEREHDERRYHVWERRYGSFKRSFKLPRTVQADGISADFENGLLRVRMPKAPEARSRRIQIGSNGDQ